MALGEIQVEEEAEDLIHARECGGECETEDLIHARECGGECETEDLIHARECGGECKLKNRVSEKRNEGTMLFNSEFKNIQHIYMRTYYHCPQCRW